MEFIQNFAKETNQLYKSSMTIAEEPLFKLHKQMHLLLKNSNSINSEIYKQFLSDLDIFSSKENSSLPLKIYNELKSRNLIYLGKCSATKNYNIPGAAVITPNKELAGIILDMNTMEVNDKGISSKCDLAFYSLYFEYVRAAIVINEAIISKDEELDSMLTYYLQRIFLKFLGTSLNLNEKQKSFLIYCINYFYYRFMKNQHHEIALSNSLDSINEKDFMMEAKFILKTFEKYEKMKDIFKGFIDFKITSEAPAVAIMKFVSKYNMFTFYCLTTSLDYLSAMLVLSMYPTSLFPPLGLKLSPQYNLEQYLAKHYFNKVKYNLNYFTKKQG